MLKLKWDLSQVLSFLTLSESLNSYDRREAFLILELLLIYRSLMIPLVHMNQLGL